MADQPVEQRVTISVTANGNMTYHPSVLRARRSDPIIWKSENPFTVVFAQQSPLEDDEREIHSEPHRNPEKQDKVEQRVGKRVADDAPYGAYRYHVAIVFREIKNDKVVIEKVFLDAGCGDVIVGR